MQTNEKIERVLAFLRENKIAFEILRHEPVVTCEDSAAVIQIPNCISCKSLFVKDKKSDNYYMLILPAYKRGNMRGLAAYAGCEKFEFASQEKLQEKLNATRGSVSPFSLLYDKENAVRVLIDRDVMESKLVKFHPNDNTATVVFDGKDLRSIMKIMSKNIIEISAPAV